MRDSIAFIRRTSHLGQVGLIAAAYFLAAKMSLLLAIPPGYATAVWPPSGIALAALLLLGNRVWPGIWVGAALANFTVNTSAFLAPLIACGNTLEALAASALIRRHIGVPYRFNSGEEVVKFAIVCASTAIIAATFGAGSIVSISSASSAEFAQNWFTWWEGDTVGIIIITPLILSWSKRGAMDWSWSKRIEGASFALLLLVATLLIFGGATKHVAGFSLIFLIVPFIIWAAFRFGQRQVTLANATVCSIAIWYTVDGRGPFASASLNETLLLLLAFVSTIVVTGLVLSAVVSQRSRAAEALQRALQELEEQAIRDSLTGLHNRRYLRDFLARELVRAKRTGMALAVIMIDLDRFKRVNDTFGHDAGDLVLTEVADLLKKSVRGSDMVCRFGGEEFVLVLTETTREVALRRCEQLRAAIGQLEPRYQGRALGKPSASFGVALFPYHADDYDSLVRASDQALYQAKHSGRDQIAIAASARVDGPGSASSGPSGAAPSAKWGSTK